MELLPLVVVVAASVVAAVTDIWKFKVNNYLTFPLMVSGLFFYWLRGDLLFSVQGTLCGFGILIVFFVLGGMGAGDVKLMMGIGAWLGWQATLLIFIVSALAAGLYAVALMILTGQTRETYLNLVILMHRLRTITKHLGAEDQIEGELDQAHRRQRVIPYAAMIALAIVLLVVWVWLQSPGFAAD